LVLLSLVVFGDDIAHELLHIFCLLNGRTYDDVLSV
jgi:hypothetical protein